MAKMQILIEDTTKGIEIKVMGDTLMPTDLKDATPAQKLTVTTANFIYDMRDKPKSEVH
ncbi:hypothetical protein [Neisseria sp. S1]|uniref:hypothetical protein n=1 Tax=Neisseria sp. S1 TaxID=3318354 RepID=UPI003A8C7EDB